jgi:hypothetical protein
MCLRLEWPIRMTLSSSTNQNHSLVINQSEWLSRHQPIRMTLSSSTNQNDSLVISQSEWLSHHQLTSWDWQINWSCHFWSSALLLHWFYTSCWSK